MLKMQSTLENLADVTELLKNLNTNDFDDGALAPLANAIKGLAAYLPTIDAEIQKRAIEDGKMLPGVVVKDAVTHRKWHDAAIASDLAFSQFGLKAFKLESPAAIEKLGDEGKALVAVASYKPEAGKRVVY